MSTDRFETDTLIDAPVERVWSVVVAPGFWVADEDSVAGTVATAGESTVIHNPKYGDFPVRVEKVDSQSYVAYRWTTAFPGEALTTENSTLIEFSLSEEGDGTRLSIAESGFAALPVSDEARAKVLADNSAGWPSVLGEVKARAEA